MRKFQLIAIPFALVVYSSLSVADYSKDPVTKGLEIAKNLDQLNDNFKDLKSNLEMILRDRHGRESKRKMTNSTLEVKGDGDKSLIVFITPPTVKGTKFLSFTHKSGADDQWLFLPRLKRVKRIASNNKSGPFMGSEFSYEDIASQEVEKYTYKFIKDEACGDLNCHVVERYPTDKDSGYSRQKLWIVKEKGLNRVSKIDYFDIKGTHLKTLEFKGYQQYLKKFWRAELMNMKNHVTGKSTTLRWTDYQFQTGLNSRDFDKNALKRSR